MERKRNLKQPPSSRLSVSSGNQNTLAVEDDTDDTKPVEDFKTTGEGHEDDLDEDGSESPEPEPNWDELFNNRKSPNARKQANTMADGSRHVKETKYKNKRQDSSPTDIPKKKSSMPPVDKLKGRREREASLANENVSENIKRVAKHKDQSDNGGRSFQATNNKNLAQRDDPISVISNFKSSPSAGHTSAGTRADLTRPSTSAASVSGKPKVSYLFHDAQAAARLTRKSHTPKKPQDGMFSESKTFLTKLLTSPQPSQLAKDTPWLVNEKDAPRQDKLAKYKFFASSRLRYKARTMIGATGSRHFNQKRRSSLASGTTLPLTLVPNLEHINEGEEERMAAVQRRRVVDNTDLRTMAILQSRLKELKTYPE
ncbi:hypothetical protein ElyMa_000941300 [Elysia marginata]|uniref:Uncharacterized protein n=1 Tax=Elysia marginata TaxID=1093978 RepID=A0AAV4HE42_9GAST|nr:hypothetical protein ElyMa_000941300 [Elysia marginata]